MSALNNLRSGVAAALLTALVVTACGSQTEAAEDAPDGDGRVSEPRIYPPTDVPVVDLPPRIYPPTEVPSVEYRSDPTGP